MRLFAVAALTALFLPVGCSKPGAPAGAPTDTAVVAGDGRFTVTWTAVPNVEYWLFYAPAPEITKDNWDLLPGVRLIRPAYPPAVVTGVFNGTSYAFMIDGRIDSGPGGPTTPSQSVVPRPAGASWTAGTSLGAMELRGLAYGTRFVVVDNGGEIRSSPDGAAWTTLTSPAAGTALNAALYSSGNYLAAGAGGVILRSTDAVTWTAQTSGTVDDLYALAAGGGLYVAVGAQGTIVKSSDGQAWTFATDSSTATLNTLYGLIYANSRHVAVGAAGTILTSSDGNTWTPATSNTPSELRSIVWGANTFVAVGANGTLVTSPDGLAWTTQTAFGTDTLTSVTYASQFVAVGLSGTVYTSTDGLTWQFQTSGTPENLLAVAPGNFGYMAVGAAGTNLVAH